MKSSSAALWGMKGQSGGGDGLFEPEITENTLIKFRGERFSSA